MTYAIIGGVCVLLFGAMFVLTIVAILVLLFIRIRKKGVKISDGISDEEWKLARQAIAETLAKDNIKDGAVKALQKLKKSSEDAMQHIAAK